MVTPVTLVVAAALRDGSGRVLVQQRPPGKAHAGLWEFPGGKVEAGETPEAALCRELREELAVEVAADDCSPVTFATERGLLLLLFECTAWRGEPVAQEGAILRWATPDGLARLPMPPADRGFPAALAALNDRPSGAPRSPECSDRP